MDEVVVRRVVGVVTLAIAAFLLSWLLPRPGLDRLRGAGERVVTMDLTRADSRPEESVLEPSSDGDGEQVAEPKPDTMVRAEATPVAPAPVPPVVAADPAPPESAPAPVDVIALPKAEPKPEPKVEPKPLPKPVSKPEPKPEPKPAVTPAPVAKPAAPGPSGNVMVQAGAYSLLDKAEGVRKRASARGVSCFIAPAETAKGTLYRLRCGPFTDRAKATLAVQALAADGIAAQVVGAQR